MLILTISVSKSLKRSSSASYEGNCAEQTPLKANGINASTTFLLPRKSLRRHSSFPAFRVKSGAISPTWSVFVSERLLSTIVTYPSQKILRTLFRKYEQKLLVLLTNRLGLCRPSREGEKSTCRTRVSVHNWK